MGDIGRIGAGVMSFGTSELANELGGGFLFDEGGLFGDPSQAGSRAAAAQAQGKQQGIQTLTEQLGPFAQAGLGGLEQLVGGSTVEGLGGQLEKIFGSQALRPLIDERSRAVENRNAAGGNFRSGAGLQAAAQVPTDIGFMIENLLSGRNQNLATQGLGSGFAQGVAGLQSGIGQDIGSGIVTDQQAKAQQFTNLINTGATVASFFSDPRLKENVEEIGQIDDLKIYQWDWIKETANTFVEKFPTMGFMADEVEGAFPEFVSEYLGFKIINYNGLLNKLGAS